MTTYSMDELAEASPLSRETLASLGDDELAAHATAVLLDDEGAGAVDGDEPIPLDDLDAETVEEVVGELARAVAAGADISGLLRELADMGLDVEDVMAAVAERTEGVERGANSAGLSSDAQVFCAHNGLPPTWSPLADVEFPEPLRGAVLTDEAVAEVVNRLAGRTEAGNRLVTAQRVSRVRDGVSGPSSDRETGVSLEAFEAEDSATTRSTVDPDADLADMVGMDPAGGDGEVAMDARQAVQVVEAWQARRGGGHAERTGVGLDDIDAADGGA